MRLTYNAHRYIIKTVKENTSHSPRSGGQEDEMKYNVISKETKINPVTGQEIPVEIFTGPYTIVGHDIEKFYVVHSNNGNYCAEDVEGCIDIAPQITGFEKVLYKVTEY